MKLNDKGESGASSVIIILLILAAAIFLLKWVPTRDPQDVSKPKPSVTVSVTTGAHKR